MEPKKQVGSSFTSDLFGNKDSHTSDVLASIFPPPKGVGATWQHQSAGNQQGNSREDAMAKNHNSGYPGRERAEHGSHTSGSYTFKKDGGKDDSAGASRGDWWQGSLYY